jgi:hypothetical protein
MHHADGPNDIRYGRDKPGLNVGQAKILHDLRQEKAEAVETSDKAKINEAKREYPRGEHRLEPARLKEHFPVGALQVINAREAGVSSTLCS